jgi:hypothetical protein
MTKPPVRICFECCHCRCSTEGGYICILRPNPIDVVYGTRSYATCYDERKPSGECGPNGKNYKPVEAKRTADILTRVAAAIRALKVSATS